MVVKIYATEVVELFPFAARKAEHCEVSVDKGPAVTITVDEFLEVVKSNPPMASVHEGYLGATPMWAFYTSIDEVLSNYTMDTAMTVEEARALRDHEAASAQVVEEPARGDVE